MDEIFDIISLCNATNEIFRKIFCAILQIKYFATQYPSYNATEIFDIIFDINSWNATNEIFRISFAQRHRRNISRHNILSNKWDISYHNIVRATLMDEIICDIISFVHGRNISFNDSCNVNGPNIPRHNIVMQCHKWYIREIISFVQTKCFASQYSLHRRNTSRHNIFYEIFRDIISLCHERYRLLQHRREDISL